MVVLHPILVIFTENFEMVPILQSSFTPYGQNIKILKVDFMTSSLTNSITYLLRVMNSFSLTAYVKLRVPKLGRGQEGQLLHLLSSKVGQRVPLRLTSSSDGQYLCRSCSVIFRKGVFISCPFPSLLSCERGISGNNLRCNDD